MEEGETVCRLYDVDRKKLSEDDSDADETDEGSEGVEGEDDYEETDEDSNDDQDDESDSDISLDLEDEVSLIRRCEL